MEVFDKVIEPLYDKLFAKCLYLCEHRYDAEDLMQDFIIRAISKGDLLLKVDNSLSYSYKMIYRQFQHNIYYKYRNGKMLGQSSKGASVAFDTATVDSRVMSKLEIDHIMRVMSTSINPIKAKMIMDYANGYSYKEISSKYGTTMQTTKNHIHRGRKKLKDILTHN